MGVIEVLLIIVIVGAAAWLLYRSLVKNKDGCAGCGVCCAGGGQEKDRKRLIRL